MNLALKGLTIRAKTQDNDLRNVLLKTRPYDF